MVDQKIHPDDPAPGTVRQWVLDETDRIAKLALDTRVTNATRRKFDEQLRRLVHTYSNQSLYSPEVVHDAEAAWTFAQDRFEWIGDIETAVKEAKPHLFKVSYYALEQYAISTRAIAKYILIAYGAAFLFSFNALISSQTAVELLPVITSSIYVLIVGFVFAIIYILVDWQTISSVATWTQKIAQAYDRSTVKLPWIYSLRWVPLTFSILSVIMLPIAVILFINKITIEDILHLISDAI